jgi:hypothetical protein
MYTLERAFDNVVHLRTWLGGMDSGLRGNDREMGMTGVSGFPTRLHSV